jgi:hypothetical protein
VQDAPIEPTHTHTGADIKMHFKSRAAQLLYKIKRGSKFDAVRAPISKSFTSAPCYLFLCNIADGKQLQRRISNK